MGTPYLVWLLSNKSSFIGMITIVSRSMGRLLGRLLLYPPVGRLLAGGFANPSLQAVQEDLRERKGVLTPPFGDRSEGLNPKPYTPSNKKWPKSYTPSNKKCPNINK